MKRVLFVFALVAVTFLAPNLRHPCSGALLAQSEEKRLPPEHWCQREVPRMDRRAHACACHAHDCSKDPNDQNNRSAHTDPECSSYCDVAHCQCEKMDCP